MFREDFGVLPDGRRVEVVTLSNGHLSVRVLTLGAITQDVRLEGVAHSLTLGSPDLAAYLGPMRYFGAIVGPVANRISNGTTELCERRLTFERNENGRTTLHGGHTGTHADLWSIEDAGERHLTLSLVLPEGRGGFPGNRRIEVDFRIADPAVLELRLSATTDAPTLMNLAHHGYWNLDGGPTVANHHLRIDAAEWLPTDADAVPTGEIRPVDGTPWDFRTGTTFDPRATSYDNNLCVACRRRAVTPVLEMTGRSGITLEIASTEAGLQLYGGARVDTAPYSGHRGMPYSKHAGVALEPQAWPDAPNRPKFPSIVLRPADAYLQETRFSFCRKA